MFANGRNGKHGWIVAPFHQLDSALCVIPSDLLGTSKPVSGVIEKYVARPELQCATIAFYCTDGSREARNSLSENRSTQCGVTFMPYQRTGDQQPVFLPACGHTYSRAAIKDIFRHRTTAHIQCPRCLAEQTTLRSDTDCIPNWDLIHEVFDRPMHLEALDLDKVSPDCAHMAGPAQAARKVTLTQNVSYL